MLKKLFILILIFSSGYKSWASHLMGGEITWECQASGEFVFNLKVYRDCNGISQTTFVNLDVHNYPGLSTIPLNLISQSDISPQCNGAGPTITCAAATGNLDGAVEEFVFRSNPVTLTGIPPVDGWVFTYNDCCRNAAIDNLDNPDVRDIVLRAIMYSYQGQNTNPCYDSSPIFAEKPHTVICTDYPFTYNHNAFDNELDSLYYDWADVLDGYALTWAYPFAPFPIPYVTDAFGLPLYSVASPLPGTAQNPNNIPATIEANTGEISYTSYTSGNFVTCVKVEAWKCGELVAEIFREMQVVLLACPAGNFPPTVTPPFPNNSGILTLWNDTVYAGELVSFNISATDFDLLSTGLPQTMTISASGGQFGTGYTDLNNGCIQPPCAILNPAPPVINQFGVATTFNWQTTCDHLSYQTGCNTFSNTYTFVIKTSDDFCPAPAINIGTVSVTVLPGVPTGPIINCINRELNGNITLSWTEPVDTGGIFENYQIYYSNNQSGPYVAIDSVINFSTTSYTHINPPIGNAYYYLSAKSGCSGFESNSSDTLRVIELNVNSPTGGIAELNWNDISNPLPATSHEWYMIYREYPAGIWTLIDSSMSSTYFDTINICEAFINYQITLQDSTGCVSSSNVDGDNFGDITDPDQIIIDSVTVNILNGLAEISWNQSPNNDVIAYVIYQLINGLWTPLDTMHGINNTFYQHINSNAFNESESFRISAIDSCSNDGLQSIEHNTIFLQNYLNVCTGENTLTWNNYGTWPTGVLEYEIYFTENNGPLNLLSTVPASNTSIIHNNLVQFSNYCYYIRAYDVSGIRSSTSNELCVFADIPLWPSFEYLNKATISLNNQVDISCFTDITADIVEFRIERSTQPAGPFNTIGFVPANATNPLINFTDLTALFNETSYYYQYVAVDSCETDAYVSNLGRTIFLESTANTNYQNTLNWNDYVNWDAGVESYNILRSIDGTWDPAPISTVSFGTISFNDDISNNLNGLGNFCYKIEAIESNGNSFGFKDTSYSNIACVKQLPIIHIPNAFSPEGINQFFKPKTIFIDPLFYKFIIFNRWGEEVFYTTDLNSGWNGDMYNGKPAQKGVYVYLIEYSSDKNQIISKKGTVTLIR